MVNLYFLQYNNYFNRQTKPHRTTTSWFLPYQIGSTVGVQLFNYGDGVDTTQVVNTTNWTNENRVPDYCVVEDQADGSRQYWYVTEWKYLRKGQYEATLKRDVLSEHYDIITTAPMLIKKGTVASSNDPAMFNSEGQAYNQIKSDEIPLYDATGCPWIVGYVPLNAFQADKEISKDIYVDPSFTYNTLEDFRSDFPYDVNMSQNDRVIIRRYDRYPIYNIRANIRYSISGAVCAANVSFNSIGVLTYDINATKERVNLISWDAYGGVGVNGFYSEKGTTLSDSFTSFRSDKGYTMTNTEASKLVRDIVNSYTSTTLRQIDNSIYNVYPQNEAADATLKSILYKSVKIGTKTYTIFPSNKLIWKEQVVPASTFQLLSTNLKNDILVDKNNKNSYIVTLKYYEAGYTLVESTQTIKTTMPGKTKIIQLRKDPYAMFCIPYGEVKLRKDGVDQLTTVKDAALIATGISTSAGDKTVLDVQLLPYCPIREIVVDDEKGVVDYSSLTREAQVQDIKNEADVVISKMFWCTDNSFSFQIPLHIEVDDYKIENETTTYRLCSPNYNGLFEFNLAKNGGLDWIEVNCSYKPQTPYIQLNPNFKKLYGQNATTGLSAGDYNDQRGLTCGGDFSLPNVSDEWANYQLNNKNYQNIFDREIQSMEISNKYQRISDWMNLVASAAKTGIAVGSLSHPIVGVVAGGINLATGIASNIMSDKLRDEQISLKKDLFNYNLQNIQALPQSVSKTVAFNINSKYVPFLEKYTCTEEEKNALRDKLKWQGMTVMRTGQIQDYVWADDTYIEAMPLRLTGLSEDTHTAQAIAQELNMGTYIFISEDTE